MEDDSRLNIQLKATQNSLFSLLPAVLWVQWKKNYDQW